MTGQDVTDANCFGEMNWQHSVAHVPQIDMPCDLEVTVTRDQALMMLSAFHMRRTLVADGVDWSGMNRGQSVELERYVEVEFVFTRTENEVAIDCVESVIQIAAERGAGGEEEAFSIQAHVLGRHIRSTWGLQKVRAAFQLNPDAANNQRPAQLQRHVAADHLPRVEHTTASLKPEAKAGDLSRGLSSTGGGYGRV